MSVHRWKCNCNVGHPIIAWDQVSDCPLCTAKERIKKLQRALRNKSQDEIRRTRIERIERALADVEHKASDAGAMECYLGDIVDTMSDVDILIEWKDYQKGS